MQVNFNPIITNKNKPNRNYNTTSFGQKVPYDEKWLAKIMKDSTKIDNDFCIEYMMPNTKLTLEKARATLLEAKKRYKGKFQRLIDDTLDWFENYKKN